MSRLFDGKSSAVREENGYCPYLVVVVSRGVVLSRLGVKSSGFVVRGGVSVI